MDKMKPMNTFPADMGHAFYCMHLSLSNVISYIKSLQSTTNFNHRFLYPFLGRGVLIHDGLFGKLCRLRAGTSTPDRGGPPPLRRSVVCIVSFYVSFENAG